MNAQGEIVGGRYRVTQELWTSADVRALEAVHCFTDRRVLVKVAERSAAPLLAAEARALGAIRHPHVLDVADAGEQADGSFFVAFESIDGRSLEGLLASRGRLDDGDAFAVLVALLDACARLDAARVTYHRPATGTVFVTLRGAQETVKLAVETRGGSLAPPSDRSGGATVASGLAQLFVHLVGLATTSSASELAAACPGLPPDVVALLGRVASGVDPVDAATLRTRLLEAAPSARREPRLLRPPSPPAGGAELRKFPRAEYVAPVVLRIAAGAAEGRSEDISEEGMLVVTPSRCEAGAELAIRFASPLDGRLVEARAKVAWVKEGRPYLGRPGAYAVGLRFADADEALKTAIRRYVELMGRG